MLGLKFISSGLKVAPFISVKIRPKATATRDLTDLLSRGVLVVSGKGKRDLHYTLSQK